MTILEKNQGIARRIERPEPLSTRLEQLFVAGKHQQLEHGVDAQGTRFVALKPGSLKNRGPGEPLNPPGSRIVSRYHVAVTADPARLTVVASWPGVDFVRWHQSGTHRMAQRDPGGYRIQDRQEAMRLWKEYIFRD